MHNGGQIKQLFLTTKILFFQTSSKLRTKYDTVQQKLREKQEDVAKIKERLRLLGDGAIDLFQKALIKLELLNGMSTV